MSEIWQEFLQGAETFERCAKATLSEKSKTWRTKQATATIAKMAIVTKDAWELGLLSSITQLRKHLNQDDLLIEKLISSDDKLANLFESLTGFTSWKSEKNDKTEWDVDENGETVFFVPPITYFYFEDGFLGKWGLVESSAIYIGEVHGDKDVDFDDNTLTPQNRSRVLTSFAQACRFLSEVTKAESSKNLPATISAIQVVEVCRSFNNDLEVKTIQNWMSHSTFPNPIKPGRNRVFVRQEVATWLKTNKSIKI